VSETPTVTWLTQEAYERLTAEYNHLIGPARAEIARKIEAARAEGDLRENGGYHAAKEEQGKMEARIRQLRQILENAKVGEPPADDGVVEPGMVVTVRYEDGEELTFLLGSREESAAGIEAFSPNSPLGSALLGKRVGDSASYTLPTGATMRVTVVDAKPFTG